ncbi:MAG TPA: methyltransferase domain-containing protein [Candidatus Angelobacter sp.]|nr:methyltransferase domain-containing protein [Candidatus Angelobacter sp.]
MPTPAEHFSATAEGYAATMAPSLRPMAAEVVRRAFLAAGERVVDIGTGTGTAAALARGEGRTVVGVDAAPGMLEIARAEVPDVRFVEADFGALPFDDGAFDAVLSVHALLFADDQVAVLREWRRVTRQSGRLSLSVPGPDDATPSALYAAVYERHGLASRSGYPTTGSLAAIAEEAGWSEVRVEADPSTAIVLPDEAAFRTWYRIGPRGPATAGFTPEQHRALADEMDAVTPRTAEGGYRIPFGALYLVGRNPG